MCLMERGKGCVQDYAEDGMIVNKAAKSLMTLWERARAKEAEAGVADTPVPFWGCLP
jgi:hypothetical protein